jgi:hypothetical protein
VSRPKVYEDELPKNVAKPLTGFTREWVRCKKCKDKPIYSYDYQPCSLSSPILTVPCGHDFKSEMERLEVIPREGKDTMGNVIKADEIKADEINGTDEAPKKQELISLDELDKKIADTHNEARFLQEFTGSGGEYTNSVPTQALIHALEDMRDRRISRRELLKSARDSFMKTAQIEIPSEGGE